ncbi:hypothetical protein EON79_15065 [bacterium]|nr:MAG: hypothetical protein EON79_15065 [bacterium]
MAPMTARQKIAEAGPSEVHTLDPAKAARFGARTMLIPSPGQVRDAIWTIPHGERKTVLELRQEMAEASGAEVTCPRATTLAWFLVAEAAEEERAAGASEVTPWWRVTRDGRPDPRLPGGAARHRELWESEGT